MQVGVLVGVSDRSGDVMVPPVGDWPPPPPSAAGRLVVDPCVVGDGRVVEVAAWVKKGGDSVRTRLLVHSGEVVDRGGPGDLYRRGVIRRPKAESIRVGPIGRLVSSSARCVGDGDMQVVSFGRRFRPERDRDSSTGGGLATASSTPPRRLVLVVDPCVVGDGRVVQVAAWVKKGDGSSFDGTRLLVRSGSR